jgi:hypothetical protein
MKGFPPVQDTSVCMKTWANAQPALEESCCHRQGIPGLGDPLLAFTLQRHGQKIYVINCHNFCLAAAEGGREHQYAGGAGIGDQDGR